MKTFLENSTAHFSFTFLALLLYASKTSSQSAIPVPDHVVIVILENHAYEQIIGSSTAPYINMLANDSNAALFTKSYAIEHPSQPNYLDFFSGCNQGVTNDNVPTGNPYSTDNLGRQLAVAGKTFITYSENLPAVGYNGATSGAYARKHNPVTNWMGTGINQVSDSTNQPLTAFPVNDFDSLPTVCYVVPNQDNDMHNGSDPARIITADTWIYNHLFEYIQWAKTHNSLFVLTFDEDNDVYGNHIVTLFKGPMVVSGQYAEAINHYSVLRTIEDMYRLTYVCNASTASSISDCWTIPTSVNYKNENDALSVYPVPGKEDITITIPGLSPGNLVKVRLYNMPGQEVFSEIIHSQPLNKIHLKDTYPGLYILNVITNEKEYFQKLTICK